MSTISIFATCHVFSLLFLVSLPTGGNGLLTTYNFHNPIQFQRLFKSDPMRQVALMRSFQEVNTRSVMAAANKKPETIPVEVFMDEEAISVPKRAADNDDPMPAYPFPWRV